MYFDSDLNTIGDALGYILLFIVPGLLLILYPFVRPTGREVIFDRANQTVTVPGKFWSRSGAAPFSQAKVEMSAYPIGNTGMKTFLALKVPGVWGQAEISMASSKAEREADWSFYVWYMDKNRPLPPSEALDAYRERDAARRAAEGHPPPLYHSHIHPDNPGPAPAEPREERAERA